MKNINLAISGCMGRMGQQLIKSSKKNKNFKLVALTENRSVNKKFNGIRPEFNSDKAFKKADVIIDFTVPKCTLEILKIASKLRKKVVIGTVKSIITSVFLKALSEFNSGLIPLNFLFTNLFSVSVINLKFLFFLDDFISCWPILPMHPEIAKLIFFIQLNINLF